MFRKMVCAGFVVLCGLSVAVAAEFNATISKVDGNNVTFTKREKGQKGQKGQKGEPMTLTAAKDVKVANGKYNKDTNKVEVGEPLSGGLTNEKLSNISDKGVRAHIITSEDGKTITEIHIMQGGRGGKGKKGA
jgi:hypothetical protein